MSRLLSSHPLISSFRSHYLSLFFFLFVSLTVSTCCCLHSSMLNYLFLCMSVSFTFLLHISCRYFSLSLCLSISLFFSHFSTFYVFTNFINNYKINIIITIITTIMIIMIYYYYYYYYYYYFVLKKKRYLGIKTSNRLAFHDSNYLYNDW